MVALLLTLPAAGWALSVQEQIVEQLTEQGFYQIEVSRTLLGRVRIVAVSLEYRREIVFNPTTGEILRDYVAALDGAVAEPKVFLPGVPSTSSGRGGNSGSGGGHVVVTEDDDDPDSHDDEHDDDNDHHEDDD